MENTIFIRQSIEGIDLYEFCMNVFKVANFRGEVPKEILIPQSVEGKKLFKEQVAPQSLSYFTNPVEATPYGGAKVTINGKVEDNYFYVKIKIGVDPYPDYMYAGNMEKMISYQDYINTLLPGKLFVGTVINCEYNTVIGQCVSNDLTTLKSTLLAYINGFTKGKASVSLKDIPLLGFGKKTVMGPDGKESISFGYLEVPAYFIKSDDLKKGSGD